MSNAPIEIPEKLPRNGDVGAMIALGNRLLSQHPNGSEEHERGLDLLHSAAAAGGALAHQAHWFLGAYFVQVPVRPDAHAQAAHWLGLAANAGYPPAMDRFADLHLLGAGVSYSPSRALHWQRRLADNGFGRAAWEAAYLIAAGAARGNTGQSDRDQHNASASALARACALGFPPAYFSLGLRFAAGDGVPMDRAYARALLLRAADAGFPLARETADELVPAPEVGARADDWHARLKANMASAPLEMLQPGRAVVAGVHAAVEALEAHFAGVAHPAIGLDDSGRVGCCCEGAIAPNDHPSQFWQWLGERPRVGIIRDFATREECAYMMFKMAQSLRQASDYRRSGSANDDAEILYFNGRGDSVGAMQSDSVVRTPDRRVATATDWPVESLEPCSVVRYLPGEEYRPHVDFFSPDQIAKNAAEGRDFGGQRVATFLLYLRAPEAGGGGETVYERTGIRVCGEQGVAVLHYNVTEDGIGDDASLHSGKPVQRGEKWLWRSTLREHCLYRPGPAECRS